jgi:hypothetical protein
MAANPFNSVAFTGRTASIAIPGAPGRDNLTVASAASVPNKGQPLPTPPNSISPSLPPHVFQGLSKSAVASEHVESDIDLQDSHEVGSPSYEATGMITPALLARHHLPSILLSHGPLAIRHIMGYLTTSVPGFSGIPPAKARRLVVGALEGRGNGGENGGLNGDVKFEKVGWGRWDARLANQPRSPRGKLSPPPSISSSFTPTASLPILNSSRFPRREIPSSFAESAVFSHPASEDEDITMLENEADKMSLDGSDDEMASSSDTPDEELPGNEEDDMTDDEDWAALGAAALRKASYTPSAGAHPLFANRRIYPQGAGPASYAGAGYGGGIRGNPRLGLDTEALGRSVPLQRWYEQDESAAAHAAQEREAVEALLRLGSV